MSKTILNYKLSELVNEDIAIRTDSLQSVALVGEEIIVYALVDENLETRHFNIQTFCTGEIIHVDIEKFTFLGTVIMDGKYSKHVYYRKMNR